MEKSHIILKNNKKGDISMTREFKRLVLTILLLIPLTLLIPNNGFSGAGEPCPGDTGYFMPAYFGTVTAEWNDGDVSIYGSLICGERNCTNINIKKEQRIVIANGVSQVNFLSVDSSDIRFNYSFIWPPIGCLQVSSASNLDYKSQTLFTVDVVVMGVQ